MIVGKILIVLFLSGRILVDLGQTFGALYRPYGPESP